MLNVVTMRKFLRTSVNDQYHIEVYAVAFEVLPLGSFAPIPAPSSSFETILELILWNGVQSCRRITPDVIKLPSFQYFLYLREQKKVTGGRIR
jgi:hypothetical protein